MTLKATQWTKSPLSVQLAVIFGVGNVIKVVLDDDGVAVFTDEGEGKTNNTLKTTLPEDTVLFGPGEYKITVYEDHFEFEEIEA